jgi:hypothetical protein
MKYRAGQYRLLNARQISEPLSTATGQMILLAIISRRTLSRFCSNSNSGVWIPTTTSPFSRYLSCQARMRGSVRSQLIQVYVPKSTRTTRPRRSAADSGSEYETAIIVF